MGPKNSEEKKSVNSVPTSPKGLKKRCFKPPYSAYVHIDVLSGVTVWIKLVTHTAHVVGTVSRSVGCLFLVENKRSHNHHNYERSFPPSAHPHPQITPTKQPISDMDVWRLVKLHAKYKGFFIIIINYCPRHNNIGAYQNAKKYIHLYSEIH